MSKWLFKLKSIAAYLTGSLIFFFRRSPSLQCEESTRKINWNECKWNINAVFKQMIQKKEERNIHVVFKQTNSPTYQFIQIKSTFFNFVIGFSPLINLSKILNLLLL